MKSKAERLCNSSPPYTNDFIGCMKRKGHKADHSCWGYKGIFQGTKFKLTWENKETLKNIEELRG